MNHPLGQSLALLTAITWAYALILFKLSGERISPIALNLFKNVVGLVLLVATLGVLIPLNMTPGNVLTATDPGDICILLLSGIIGIALADTIFFHALNRIGVGLLSIVDCAYSPMAILFAWLLLGETLNALHYCGAALVVSGVFIATRHKVPENRTRGDIIFGMFLAATAVSMMAFGIVMAKPALEHVPLVWATTLRMAAGTVLLGLFARLGPWWRQNWNVFRPSRTWGTALPGAILGTYICMIMWVGGFKYTYASVASVLNQSSVVFASIFAALILKERFGGRKITALALALTGVLIVTMNEQLWKLIAWASTNVP